MFEATLSSVVVLRKIIDSIKDLVQEVNLEANPDGLSLQAMDSAHVSLVSLQLNESGFAHYRCDKSITLGLNLTDFAKILRMGQNDDQVTLKADDSNSFLEICFENKTTEKSAEFQLNLLTLDTEALGIPDTKYPTIIKMSSGEFVRLVRELSTLAESVKISVNSKIAEFAFEGKSGNGKINLKSNNVEKEEDQVTITCDEDVTNSFGLTYLNSFAKASSLSYQVKLNLSNEYPLMIEYDIESMGFVKFYLAPKMEESD